MSGSIPTYRQLDYWASKGYLPGGNPGSGCRRRWADGELSVAALMGELRAAGLELAAAARVARELHEHERATLGPGLAIIRTSNGRI